MRQITISTMLLLAVALLPGFVLGQRAISGKVTDGDTGEPLAGVTVFVPGTSTGTGTDGDGNYRLELPEGAASLSFRYVTYEQQDVAIGTSNVINVALSSTVSLDEVLVVGYGTVKKSDATGSIQAVDEKLFNKGAITSPQELLTGKIAGVQITNNGDPGGGATIRIRGGSSLSASNDPLIVIDGIPVANDGISGSRNPLNIVNPNDIESFTVLKDASATAIYGSRASNGVILITTKKGALGKKMAVGYNGSVAVSSRANEIDVLSGEEYRTLIGQQFADGHPARTLLGSANTDWQDEIFQTGVTHDHNVNMSGGVGSVPYRVSLGYTDRTGLLKTDKFNRTTGSINVNPKLLNNRLQINLGLKGMLINNDFADNGAIGNAVRFDPTQPVMDAASPYGGYFFWTQTDGTPNTLAPSNPLALLNSKQDKSDVSRYIANASFDYRFAFLPELRANLNLGYDRSNGKGTILVPATSGIEYANGGRFEEYEQTQKNELLDFYLNYVKDFGTTKLDVMGGYSWQHFFREDFSYSTNEAGTDSIKFANRDPKEWYLLSVFGRLNYNILDKYFFTFTMRRDGTSRFAEDNRWGIFPAGAFAWKMVDQSSGALSNLKLRVGFGITGQQDINDDFYPSLARYLGSTDNARYQLGNAFYTTLRPNGYDANIKWEETTTYNVGFDYGFLNDRIYGSVDYYQRYTEDLLNFIPVPAGTNLTNFITTNVGDLENNGIEVSVNVVPVLNDKVNWEIGVNFTRNVNEITRLTAIDDPNYQGVETGSIAGGVGNNIQVHSVGFPASSFYVFEQVYDESGVPVEGLYVDRNGDGQVTPEDKYRLEKPAPDMFFGLTSRLEIGKFEFLFAGRANIGNYVYNNIISGATYNSLYNSTNYLSNTNAQTQAIDFNIPQYFSDHFVQDASFLRIDHITLGYDLSDLSDAFRNLKVSLIAQNPILITDYEGLDPEIFNGIDNNIYPRSRSFILGVNASF